MPQHKNHVQDVLLSLSLLALFSLPLAWLFPTTFSSFFQLVISLGRTLLWLLVSLGLLVTVGGTALVGEKAYKRFTSAQASPSNLRNDDINIGSIGKISKDSTEDERRRFERVTRESRMEQVAERVVDGLEATGVGKLFHRRTVNKGKGRAKDEDEAVELKSMRGTSSGITRAPPPLPPR